MKGRQEENKVKGDRIGKIDARYIYIDRQIQIDIYRETNNKPELLIEMKGLTERTERK